MTAWSLPVRLADIARGPVTLDLLPDVDARAAVARVLDLEGLLTLTGQIEVRPWLDGAELLGRFQATALRICGVTLEPFDESVTGEIEVRLVPAGSPHAAGESGGELALDIDAPDPPDEMEGDVIDVAAYVVEHLALELDPFPRKPGAEFDYKPEGGEVSPFAALAKLKGPDS